MTTRMRMAKINQYHHSIESSVDDDSSGAALLAKTLKAKRAKKRILFIFLFCFLNRFQNLQFIFNLKIDLNRINVGFSIFGFFEFLFEKNKNLKSLFYFYNCSIFLFPKIIAK